MTTLLKPGQRLLADAAALAAASPLSLADSVAETVGQEVGQSVRLVSAELETNGAVRADAGELVTPSAIVTAVLSHRGRELRTEVTARFEGDGASSASVRFVFSEASDNSDDVSDLFCPGSAGWNSDLRDRLREDSEFSTLIEAHDGTIGLSIGGRPVHIRCYRGHVLEVVPRSVLGADFVLSIPGDVFIDLMTGERNRFMEAAMSGTMRSSGSGYEYLRMTSALIRIIDQCRAIAVAAGYVGSESVLDQNLQVA
jgi:putative sterol carrier protein